MFDLRWLRVQPTWVLADALDAACDALESGRLFGLVLLDAWDYAEALGAELVARGDTGMSESVTGAYGMLIEHDCAVGRGVLHVRGGTLPAK
jgi:hypothetical protein